MRKAQITLFLIIAIVLVMTGSLYLLFNKSADSASSPDNTKTGSIQQYFEECLAIVGKDAVQYVALGGGYYSNAAHTARYQEASIPYYWKDNQSLLPSGSFVAGEIEHYVLEEFSACYSQSNPFERQGYSIEPGFEFESEEDELLEGEPAVKISLNSVRFYFQPELVLRRGNEELKVDDLSAEITSDLGTFYQVAKNLIDAQVKAGGALPLSDIALNAYDHGFTYEIVYLDDGQTVIISLINDEGLIFSFASQNG